MANLYIDIGSTFIKYAVDDGPVGCTAFPLPTRKSAYLYEIPVEDVMGKIVCLLERSDADKVFFSVQMHGYILSDARHRPITQYVSWRDTFFESLDVAYPFSIGFESGTSLKNNLPALSVYARFEKMPALRRKAAYFDTLGSYIVYRLTGAHRIHVTDACPTGFYLLPRGDRNPAVTALPCFCGLTFPPATDKTECVGHNGKTAVFVPVGDQQASVYGVGLDTGEYLFNTGTAGQLCCLSDGLVCGDFESRPYFGGKTLCTVSGLVGGFSSGSIGDERQMREEYRAALGKLPACRRLLSTGGLVKRHRPLFERIYREIVGDYAYIDMQSAIVGLQKLSRSI